MVLQMDYTESGPSYPFPVKRKRPIGRLVLPVTNESRK